MPETLDARSIIKELADAEWECRSGIEHDYGTCAAGCEDGYIIPFKALRVPCPWTEIPERNGWQQERDVLNYEAHKADRCGCQGRGWVPEPDVERACWRVHIAHPYVCYATNAEEELRDAKAWLESQRCGM